MGKAILFDMENLFIIKIGGNLLDEPDGLSLFLERFSAIREKKILVHGGGKIATRIGQRMGIAEKYQAGRRVTDEPTLELVTMVYGGLVNKKLVARLQSLGCNALGLTGADGGLIPARKRPVRDQDFGFAGDVDYSALRADACQSLIRIGLVPVFAPLTFDPDAGGMLNTNGDTIASALAMALSAFYSVRLIFCFDRPGVLERMEDSASVIHDLDRARFEELKSGGALHSGILPKLTAAFEAIGHGVSQVWMGEPDQLEDHLNSGPGGTLIHP